EHQSTGRVDQYRNSICICVRGSRGHCVARHRPGPSAAVQNAAGAVGATGSDCELRVLDLRSAEDGEMEICGLDGTGVGGLFLLWVLEEPQGARECRVWKRGA